MLPTNSSQRVHNVLIESLYYEVCDYLTYRDQFSLGQTSHHFYNLLQRKASDPLLMSAMRAYPSLYHMITNQTWIIPPSLEILTPLRKEGFLFSEDMWAQLRGTCDHLTQFSSTFMHPEAVRLACSQEGQGIACLIHEMLFSIYINPQFKYYPLKCNNSFLVPPNNEPLLEHVKFSIEWFKRYPGDIACASRLLDKFLMCFSEEKAAKALEFVKSLKNDGEQQRLLLNLTNNNQSSNVEWLSYLKKKGYSSLIIHSYIWAYFYDRCPPLNISDTHFNHSYDKKKQRIFINPPFIEEELRNIKKQSTENLQTWIHTSFIQTNKEDPSNSVKIEEATCQWLINLLNHCTWDTENVFCKNNQDLYNQLNAIPTSFWAHFLEGCQNHLVHAKTVDIIQQIFADILDMKQTEICRFFLEQNEKLGTIKLLRYYSLNFLCTRIVQYTIADVINKATKLQGWADIFIMSLNGGLDRKASSCFQEIINYTSREAQLRMMNCLTGENQAVKQQFFCKFLKPE